MSLPNKLKHFVSAWESTAAEFQTFQELTSRFLMEEEKIKSRETVTALSNKVKSNKKKHTESRAIKCFACNKMGHIAKNCHKAKEHEQKKEQRTCYLCKKPGHLIADCRFNKNKKNKEDKRKSKQKEMHSSVKHVRYNGTRNAVKI